MLVLTRKIDQTIVIGDIITVKILGVERNRVKVGIEAPKAVTVLRGELLVRNPVVHYEHQGPGN